MLILTFFYKNSFNRTELIYCFLYFIYPLILKYFDGLYLTNGKFLRYSFYMKSAQNIRTKFKKFDKIFWLTVNMLSRGHVTPGKFKERH